MEAIVDRCNLQQAWSNVRANRGAPGPDGITLAEFPDWLRPQLLTIIEQLLDGTYQPSPVRRVEIDKPDGGTRQLGIPDVLDRVIQQAIVQVLTPLFDPTFSDSSHGFRPKRSAHGAAKQVQRTIRRSHCYAVDMDLSKFFDRGISMDRRLSELRSYLRGWIGYYGLAAQLKLFDKFDQWIRRRIRMCGYRR